MSRILLGAALVVSLAAVEVAAQARAVQAAGLLQVDAFYAPAPAGMAPSAATPGAASEVKPEEGTLDPSTPAGQAQQQRLQRIQQLQFDRRPSAILKAWNEAQAEAAQAAEKEKEKENAAEGEKDPAKQDDAADEAKNNPAEAAAEVGQDNKDGDEADQPAEEPSEPSKDEEKPADGDEADEAKPANGAEAADSANDKQDGESADNAADGKEGEAKPETPPQPSPEELAKAAQEFAQQLAKLQRDVTLGNWRDVKIVLAGMPRVEGKALYLRMLDSLRTGPQGQQAGVNVNALQQMAFSNSDPASVRAALAAAGQGPGAAMLERNIFAIDDVVGLVLAAPIELESETFGRLGTLARLVLDAGHDLDALTAACETLPEGSDRPVLDRRQIALLLMASGQEVRAGDFLPSLDEAREETDREALNLLARHLLALHAKERKTAQLEQAWLALQEVLAAESDGDEKQKAQLDEALRRAVELAPRLRAELGQTWLDESFGGRIHRGREILSAIGTHASLGPQTYPHDADHRHKTLELQRTAVEALLRAAPETANQWRDVLSMLAFNWLREADLTYRLDNRNSLGPQWRRDRYGNFFYIEEDGEQPVMPQMRGQLVPIATGDLLDIRPSGDWLKLVDDSLQAHFAAMFSKLYLKANEETLAFPYIEQLAKTNPEEARDLAHEFLRVWARNHDPNESRGTNTPYMYIWGYEQRAERIPLTRSKQERNLQELADWARRLRELPLEELDEKLLVAAFTKSHSQAEVYRLEALEQVFGSIDALEPRTLANLIQDMRGNLASVWRTPAVQDQSKTNRKQKDIQAEIERGYALADAVVRRAREKHPDDWSLQLAEASIRFDMNDYRHELAPDSDYSAERQDAMQLFTRAAELYAQAIPDLPEDQQTAQVYEAWFYAGLGSVDLGRITPEKVPDLRQPALVREAILALPGDAAERHMAEFANHLFTRLSSAKAELKFRYLRTGFEVVGDHKLAREARKVLDYYDDLVSEIRLETVVDGSDAVGHDRPFGVYVNLVHTKEIERESGGFGRYLQNQNSSVYYSYNYGRPTEDYRDRFSEAATQSLAEHFEVVSVTFQDPKVTSRALPEYGWRVTPYAYLLLKAKGPEVDKLPPLRLDLDFLDTSGYAIIPVESPALAIDASSDVPPSRPAKDLSIIQTLDERQSADGKLVLEVKATAHGLVPELEELVELKPAGFEIVDVADDGVSVSEFDQEAEESIITSQRIWLVSMQAAEGAPRPTSFTFGAPNLDGAKMIYQRYVDADLLAVEPTISLEARYGRTSYAWLWIAGVMVLIIAIAAVFAWQLLRRRSPKVAQVRFAMPEPVTPFTVLGLLRDIEHNNGLTPDGHRELAASIDEIERHYFQEADATEPQLRTIAEDWLRRTATGV